MHPTLEDLTVVDTQHLHAGQVVFDAVYTPLKTKFLREAEARGCQIVPGSEMLLLQGVAQFEYWTGQDAPVELMRTVLLNRLTGKE
jgi:shikimate dehydrogenase